METYLVYFYGICWESAWKPLYLYISEIYLTMPWMVQEPTFRSAEWIEINEQNQTFFVVDA